MKEREKIHGNVEEFDAGDELVSWETWEYPPNERSVRWYIIAGTIGVALMLAAILMKNYLFAIIILMTALIFLLNIFRQPKRIRVYITTLGVVIGNDFHSYKEVKDFSIIYEPPEIKNLYIDFISRFHPIINLPLEDIDPNAVRECLLPFVFENLEREEESLTDILRRLYKL